jgi:hypothetical protein
MNMHLARFAIPERTKFHWNVSKLPSLYILVIANVDIHAIVSTIQNYGNRTVTAIFDNSSAVQSTVTNNKTIQQTVIHLVPMMHNPRITFCHTQIFRKIWQYISMAQMIRIGTLIYIEKWCLIAVINMVNYIVGFLLTLFSLLLLWWININSSFIFNLFQSWLNMW